MLTDDKYVKYYKKFNVFGDQWIMMSIHTYYVCNYILIDARGFAYTKQECKIV